MSSWQKVITFGFCTLFILVPLIWLPNTSELFEFPKIIVTYILTIIIVGFWIARCIAEKRWIFKRTPLDWPIIIFLASSLISTLVSIDVHTSIYGYYSRWNGGFLSLFSYALLYWAFVSNMNRKSSLLTVNCSLITAAIVAIYGGLEHFGWSPSCLLTRGSWGVDCWVQDVKNRVFATLGQPNWLAAYIVSLIFIPLSNLLKFQITNPKSQINSKFSNFKFWDLKNYLDLRILNLVFFALLFAALLFTKSRSGILAFGVSAIVFWGLAWGKGSVIKIFGIFATSIFLLSIAFPNPIRDLVIKSVVPAPVGPALETGGTESGSIRKIVWTGALRIWRDSAKNFLLGTGPETFAQSYYQFRPVEHNRTSEWELLYNKAHNEYLNYLATTGLLGLISYLVLLTSMAIVISSQFIVHRNTKNHELTNQLTTIALLAGWSSIIVTNFWGFSVVIVQLLLFLLPAMAVALEVQSDKGPKVQSKLSGGQIFMLLLCTSATLYPCYLTARYFLADIKYATALNLVKIFQTTGQPQYMLSAYQQYTSAYTLNPTEPAISSELSVSAGYLANSLHLSDATSAAQLAQIAVAASDKSITTSPRHPNYFKSRARTMILLSDIDTKYLALAAEALQKAAELSPTDPRIPYNLGIIYNYLAATPSAIEQFKLALSLKPDFADPNVQLDQIVTFPVKLQ